MAFTMENGQLNLSLLRGGDEEGESRFANVAVWTRNTHGVHHDGELRWNGERVQVTEVYLCESVTACCDYAERHSGTGNIDMSIIARHIRVL